MKKFYISEVSQNYTHLEGIERIRKKPRCMYTALFLALHHHIDAQVNLKIKTKCIFVSTDISSVIKTNQFQFFNTNVYKKDSAGNTRTVL